MPEASHTQERRRFTRVLFDAPVTLNAGNSSYKTKLIDISLKGALVIRPMDWNPAIDQQVILTVSLDESGTTIQMWTRTAHLEEGQIGFVCNRIDMESITHLRRLMELNVGDSDLLERELEALG